MSNWRSNPNKCTIETRPIRMLKEFLRDDDYTISSSSDAGNHLKPPSSATLPMSRSRSMAAAEAAISSFQKLLQRSFHLISLSYWPSNKKKARYCRYSGSERKVKVEVKDILRWRSFHDVVVAAEEEPQPLDLAGPTSSGSTSSSKGSSWADSDYSFTADELPCWWDHGKSVEEEEGKKWGESVDIDGGDPAWVTTTDSAQLVPEDIIASEDDKEQHSPISVLDSPFRDEISEQELASSFDRSLANVERTKQRLLQSIQWFESLAGVDDSSSQEEEEVVVVLSEEDNAVEKANNRVYLIKGLCCLNKGGHGFKDKEVCIKDMERQGQWNNFGEEREELGVDFEVDLLHDLVDEVLVDLFG